MNWTKYKKKFSRTIKLKKLVDEDGNFLGGGIVNDTSHIEKELWVEFHEDPTSSDGKEGEFPSGMYQIHIGSSKIALQELGVFLIGMSMFDLNDKDFSLSFDISNREAEPTVHLVIHSPVEGNCARPAFSTIHTTAKGFIE
jgi:hypothetical protein